jgi:hypothetical protein
MDYPDFADSNPIRAIHGIRRQQTFLLRDSATLRETCPCIRNLKTPGTPKDSVSE